MRLSITHDTTYRYEDRVRASIQYLRLTRRTASASTWSIGAWTCRAPGARSVRQHPARPDPGRTA